VVVIIGLIVLIGAFLGPYISRYTPRAALLGTLAGISIAFHLDAPGSADVGSPVDRPTGIRDHHDRFFTGRKLPGNIPIGLAALLVGTAIGWIGGYMSAPDVVTAAKDIAIGLPTLNIDLLISAFGGSTRGATCASCSVAGAPLHGGPAPLERCSLPVRSRE
jgi:AGZA family xanthine/uracil permease-like MFS transporter